jgi:Flp pilus assembly protein TadG
MPFMFHAMSATDHGRQSLNRERGQALVEFALVLPLLLLVVLGIADFGRALGYKDDMTHLANQAARYAAVNKSPDPSNPIGPYIIGTAPTGLQNLGLNIFFTFPNLTSPNHCVGDPVRVTVQATYHWLHFLGASHAVPGSLSSTMTSTSTMRLEAKYNDSGPNAYSATNVLGTCP